MNLQEVQISQFIRFVFCCKSLFFILPMIVSNNMRSEICCEQIILI